MIHLSTLKNPSNKTLVTLESLRGMQYSEEIIRLCDQYRKSGDIKDKQLLMLLHASGRYFFIDVDGNNHVDGNTDIDFQKVTDLIPNVVWFKSPSGKGIKILIEVDRDVFPEERAAVRRYLLDTIEDLTGLVIDNSRLDVAFVSDQPVTYSYRVFHIPEKFDDNVLRTFKKSKESTGSVTAISDDLGKLDEILSLCPDHTDYNTWLSIVMSVLRLYGYAAIEMLEKKWDSVTPYSSYLKYAHDYNFDILEKIWDERTRKNAKPASKQYQRKVITGATGAGKSQFAKEEMKSLFSEAETEYNNYVIYVVSSVEQAIDFSVKLQQESLSYEIIVSSTTYNNIDDVEKKSKVVIRSSYNKAVKIIQLAALKNNSQYQHIYNDSRKLCTMYIDELTFLDFVRPSLYSSDLVNAYTGIKTSSELVQYYKRNWSKSDFSYAQGLLTVGDQSHFVSSILYQEVDTTVLTTEELTTLCLENLGFEKTVIKQKETETLLDTCTLNVSESSYYVLQCVQSEKLQQQIEEMQFCNVFANKCSFATGNLVTIKGQQIRGKNLSIIRCLPRENTSAIDNLFRGCFKSIEGINNPVALFYKDSLMQAVGRSIGFRGDTEAWVMVHSSIWTMIGGTKWIYKINDWKVDIDPDLMQEIDDARIKQKGLVRKAYAEKAQFLKNEKAAMIRANLVVTGNPMDVLGSKDIKQILGVGYTLKQVAMTLSLVEQNNKKSRYLEGLKQL